MKPAPKRPDARARLLGEFDQNAEQYMPTHVWERGRKRIRCLLRAHERDLYYRCSVALAALHPIPPHNIVGRVPAEQDAAIRAAILGPPRPAGRGKKGATK